MDFARDLGFLLLGISLGTMFGHAIGYARRPRYCRNVGRPE